jgi:hypothetical protein
VSGCSAAVCSTFASVYAEFIMYLDLSSSVNAFVSIQVAPSSIAELIAYKVVGADIAKGAEVGNKACWRLLDDDPHNSYVGKEKPRGDGVFVILSGMRRVFGIQAHRVLLRSLK